jgi:hypothetical protein
MIKSGSLCSPAGRLGGECARLTAVYERWHSEFLKPDRSSPLRYGVLGKRLLSGELPFFQVRYFPSLLVPYKPVLPTPICVRTRNWNEWADAQTGQS